MPGKYSSILWLSQIDKDDSDNVGKQAARMGEMTRAGFPIPPGFVITNHAFQHFLHENNLTTRINALLTTLHYENISSLMQVSDHIKRLILQATISQEMIKEIDDSYRKLGGIFHHATVTVKVSPHDSEKNISFHNVKGEANLILKVREAWASHFSPPELRKRNTANIDNFQEILGVIVQKMIIPDASGVALTRDPITNEGETMLIEAVYGFADESHLHDQYRVTKNDLKLLDKHVAKQEWMLKQLNNNVQVTAVPEKLQKIQKIHDNKILEIAVLSKKLEKHYYFPQLIHWAIEKNTVYFMSSRQLDPLPHKKEEHAPPSKYLPLLLKATPASPGLKKGPVRIVRHVKELAYVTPGDILVTPHTTQEFLPVMKKAAAIITEQGGRINQTAHASREFGIPAVTGAHNATKLLHAGAVVTVNGTTGEIFGGAAHANPHNGITTATKIYAYVSKTEHAETIASEHVDGVGQITGESILHEIGIHPQKLFHDGQERVYLDKLTSHLEITCKAFAPRPVVFKFTDLQTSQLRQLTGGKAHEPIESNPLIGYRGAYRLLHNARLFALELQAIKKIREENYNNIWMTIPYVRTTRELDEIKRLMNAAGLQRSPTLKLWMQVATPANLISLDSFLTRGIDGVILDLDTLISLLLGTDKHNSDIIKEYNPYDPAVLWILEQGIKICHKHYVPVSISGQTATQFPALIEKLVHWGISSINVDPQKIHTTRKHLQEAEKHRIENAGKN